MIGKLNIVWGVLAFREGEIIRHSFDSIVDKVSKIFVVLDNYDEKTESIVKEYANRYKDKFVVAYSVVPRLSKEEEKIPHRMNGRFKNNEGIIRQQLLDMIKEENKRNKIDVLLWFDADEMATEYFWTVLQSFWDSVFSALRTNYIDMFGDFYTFSDASMHSHCKAFKFRDDINVLPLQSRAFLIPFRKGNTSQCEEYFTIHMPNFNLEYIKMRELYKHHRYYSVNKVWRIDKPIYKLTNQEYLDVVRNQTPLCTIGDYLREPNKYGYKTK